MLGFAELSPRLLQLGKVVIEAAKARGAIVAPIPQPDEEAIKKMTEQKVKSKEDSDCKMVIKVCDAEECLDRTINDTQFLSAFARAFWQVIWNGLTGIGSPTSFMQALADAQKKCLQQNALRQDTPRKLTQKKYMARPAHKSATRV